MSKFKVGDKVNRIERWKDNMTESPHHIYEVSYVSNAGDSISVVGIDNKGKLNKWVALLPKYFRYAKRSVPIKRNTNIRRL